MSRVLVTGATGQIGVFLLPRLLRAGRRVIAVSRRIPAGAPWQPSQAAGALTWIGADPPGSASGDSPLLAEVDCLFSAGPLRLALTWGRACPSLSRLVCFSSSSVLVKEHSPDAYERDVIRDLLDAEAQLGAMARERNLPLALLRPTLVYGCGLDRNVSRITAMARRLGVIPLAGSAAGLRQPVHADDLAALAVAIAAAMPAGGIEATTPGGETLDYRSMVRRVFEAAGKKPRTPGVPESLLAAAVKTAAVVLGRDGPGAEAVRRQNRDLCFDTTVWERFGLAPRAFRPAPEDFAVPASAAGLQPAARTGAG